MGLSFAMENPPANNRLFPDLRWISGKQNIEISFIDWHDIVHLSDFIFYGFYYIVYLDIKYSLGNTYSLHCCFPAQLFNQYPLLLKVWKLKLQNTVVMYECISNIFPNLIIGKWYFDCKPTWLQTSTAPSEMRKLGVWTRKWCNSLTLVISRAL